MFWLIACSSDPAPPSVEAPPVAVEAPAAEVRYVSASVLKLREAADGKVVGRLAINSPVELLEQTEGWTQVRVGNGKEGWVGADYLSEAPMTAAQARQRAQAEPEERLSWLQRAAAIQSDRATLSALAAEYRAQGEDARAEIVEKQLGWTPDILAVPSLWSVEDDGVQVFLRSHDWETEQDKDGPLTARELTAEGLSVGQTWWVLPSQSAAYEAKLKRAEHALTNECAGTSAVILFLDTPPPEGEVALAATSKTPPASWNEALVPTVSREEAAKRARAQAKTGEGELSLVPTKDGWFARVAWDVSDETVDWYDREGQVIDLRLVGNRTEVLSDARRDLMEVQIVNGHRDVDGDGVPELIQGGCATSFLDTSGTILIETDWECCGC